MRFGSFFVDGFGIHCKQTFELDGQAPLVLFTGRNETGKSTIMGFIRTMLFGFPSRARPAERYEPADGGPHGGYLTLIDERGAEIRLERYDKKGYPKLHYPDGRQGGEAELAKLLSGLTPELYRNLFAFSLSELHRLETLQGDEVSGFLYGSGTGVSGSAVVQAERRLAAAMDGLYKRQGKKQPIHEKLMELEKLEAEIRKSKELSGEYNELKRQLDELEARMAEMDGRVRALRAEADWLNKCVRAREYWLNIREIEREWAEAPERYFPPPEAEALLADRPEIDRLLREAENMSRIRGEAAELRRQLASERAALEQQLRRIDPSWTLEDARRFPFAVVQRDEAEAFKRRFDRLETAIAAARERLNALDAEGEQLAGQLEADEARVEELEREIGEGLPDEVAGDPEGFSSAMNRAWLQAREDASAWSEASRKRTEARRTLDVLARKKEQAGRGKTFAPLLAVAAVAALFLAFVLRLVTREPAIAYGAGGLILLAGAAMAWLAATRREDPLAELRETWTANLAEAEREEAEAAAKAEESRQRLLRLLQALPQTREAAAARAAADPREALRLLAPFMEELERAMAGWRKKIGELEEARAALALTGKELASWRIKREREAGRLSDLEEQLAACRREWTKWLAGYRLPAHLGPESLKLMGEYAQQALDKAARIAELEAGIARREEEEAALREAALRMLEKHGALLRSCGAGESGEGPAAVGMPGAFRDGVTDAPGFAGGTAGIADGPLAPDDWLGQLHRLAGLAAEWAAVNERREATELERRQQKRMLEGWVPEEQQAALEETLLAHDADQLAALLAEAVRRSEEAEEELGRLKEESGRRKSELERLQSGEQHANLLLDSAAKEAELGQLAEQYAVYAMAALMIRRAREMYERERQPGVLRRASEYFCRITQGKYVRVLSPMGEKEILAERKDGRRLPSAMLSRGTAEQLYLAMRFALAEEYERIINLPLVMDDIFVNFDRRRLAETLAVLAEVARRHQILLFTCHDHVAEAVMAALPDSQRIELPYSS